ncbi:MAG: MFS transporter [Fimbriimonadales bacterium]
MGSSRQQTRGTKDPLGAHALHGLSADGRLLFATRIVRLFGYGLLAVVLVLYLASAGLRDREIGALLTLTLVGDTVISLWITTRADRIGRKWMLILGAMLMVAAGAVFITTHNFVLLLIAATIGVISPSGGEVGPFLAIEQAAMSESVEGQERIAVFAWYNLAGTVSTAVGALVGGWGCQLLQRHGQTPLASYQAAIGLYGAVGLVLALMFLRLTPAAETSHRKTKGQHRLGLHRSLGVVLRLSALFGLDAFAGGFVMQSIMAYWFQLRFGASPALLGSIFFGANLLAAVSALTAARLAARFGLVNTMVFTHLPSNVLLILVPLMPNLGLAIVVLLLRFAISQMDVPTRQAYVMHVVEPDERSGAAGVTGVARTIGAALSPVIALPLLGSAALIGAPFLISGGLKIVYDLALYRSCRSVHIEGTPTF